MSADLEHWVGRGALYACGLGYIAQVHHWRAARTAQTHFQVAGQDSVICLCFAEAGQSATHQEENDGENQWGLRAGSKGGCRQSNHKWGCRRAEPHMTATEQSRSPAQGTPPGTWGSWGPGRHAQRWGELPAVFRQAWLSPFTANTRVSRVEGASTEAELRAGTVTSRLLFPHVLGVELPPRLHTPEVGWREPALLCHPSLRPQSQPRGRDSWALH